MSADFFDDPENRVVLQICRTSPGFIPIVVNGRLHPIRESLVENYPVSPDLSAEDYVLGLEVLGCRLVRDANDDVTVREPRLYMSEAWARRGRRIQAIVSDSWEGRRMAISDYLHRRRND